MVFLFVCLFLVTAESVFSQGVGSGANGNLRVCVVEARGSYKRASKACPVLDDEQSGLECVIGTDRMDCLRRMSKGTVDFGVFSPEDLIAAQWANLDVLVTNELRVSSRQFEKSIVAVVKRNILQPQTIPVRSLLLNTTLCHPGLDSGDSRGLSDTLDEYLQLLLMEPSCNASMSLEENRISSLRNYFRSACKPGDWVPDRNLDSELKSRYPSLCSACRTRCSKNDEYWGDIGALACLSQVGDVTWAKLSAVQEYFGLQQVSPTSEASSFAFLCRDGSYQSLENNTSPCVWLNRPWPVIVAKRKTAEAVSTLAASLSNLTISDHSWRNALANLLEVNQATSVLPLTPQKTSMDFLAEAQGFREAYSRTGCSPPRHITICTTSLLELNKCSWLSEAGSVYGVVPPVQCALRGSTATCLAAVSEGEFDITVADTDVLLSAQRDYSVIPILHEATPIFEKTRTIFAYVKSESNYKSMEDLRGKKAAFPRFDGYAWHSVALYLSKIKNKCTNSVADFFGAICAPNLEQKLNYTSQGFAEKFTNICYKNEDGIVEGEDAALRLLVEGRVDVTFVSKSTVSKYLVNLTPEEAAKAKTEIIPICPEGDKYCLLSWSTLGHVFASKKLEATRKQEIINVLTKLDQIFGKSYLSHTAMFSMYGSFNHKENVLFHDNTKVLATDSILDMNPYDKIPMNFERALSNFSFNSCHFDRYLSALPSFAAKSYPNVIVVVLNLVISFVSLKYFIL